MKTPENQIRRDAITPSSTETEPELTRNDSVGSAMRDLLQDSQDDSQASTISYQPSLRTLPSVSDPQRDDTQRDDSSERNDSQVDDSQVEDSQVDDTRVRHAAR